MVAIQIRDVPDDLHEELVRQAEDAGQSLSRYVLRLLHESIKGGGNAAVFREAAATPGKKPPPGEGTKIIRAMRDAAANAR